MRFETVDDFVAFFEAECDLNYKLFIPDPPRETQVAKRLLDFHEKYHDHDVLADAVRWHIECEMGPFLVYEFALKINEARNHVLAERASRENFNKLLDQTREAMGE